MADLGQRTLLATILMVALVPACGDDTGGSAAAGGSSGSSDVGSGGSDGSATGSGAGDAGAGAGDAGSGSDTGSGATQSATTGGSSGWGCDLVNDSCYCDNVFDYPLTECGGGYSCCIFWPGDSGDSCECSNDSEAECAEFLASTPATSRVDTCPP